LEYRLRRHDGTYHWIMDTGIPRRGPEGQFLGYIGSCIDIEDRKKGEEELLSLHQALINAQETERQRIGQELHDDLGQRVVALLIGLSYLSEQTAGNEKLRASFADMRQQASEIVKDIAHLSHHLRPVMLERLGVAGALQDLCGKSKGAAGVKVVFSQHGELPEVVPWTASIALYRVAQEALRNALAHSGSNIIQIDLTGLGAELVMTVTDNGRGFTVAEQSMGLGLSGMAERMRNVNGILSISSAPGAGTTVTATAPLVEQHRRLPVPDPSCELAPGA
jgi:signal transduction histidine kinase